MRKKGISYKWAFISLILLAVSSFAHANTIIYVDDDANGTNDGSSWLNAYKYLQDALADANSAEKPVEIRIAQGTYKPDQGAGKIAGDREASFVLINNVTFSGGYAGIFEPDPNERNYQKYETILSGDLSGNDINVNEPVDLLNDPSSSENSYNIVKSIGTDSSIILDGFTITAGFANGDDYKKTSKGGGMYNENSQLTINNCSFIRNAGFYGAGLHNINCNLSIIECFFEQNIVYPGSYGHIGYGGRGGSIFNSGSNLLLEGCTFKENFSHHGCGGAMYNENESDLVIKDCIFFKNLSDLEGSGIYNNSSSLELTNCLFEMNKSSEGSIYVHLSNLSLNNCTFINNSAKGGSGGGIYNVITNAILKKCKFFNNLAMQGGGGGICNSSGNEVLNE